MDPGVFATTFGLLRPRMTKRGDSRREPRQRPRCRTTHVNISIHPRPTHPTIPHETGEAGRWAARRGAGGSGRRCGALLRCCWRLPLWRNAPPAAPSPSAPPSLASLWQADDVARHCFAGQGQFSPASGGSEPQDALALAASLRALALIVQNIAARACRQALAFAARPSDGHRRRMAGLQPASARVKSSDTS